MDDTTRRHMVVVRLKDGTHEVVTAHQADAIVGAGLGEIVRRTTALRPGTEARRRPREETD